MVIGCAFRDEEKASELNLAFSLEMRPSKRIVGILEDILVELTIFALLYLAFLSGPEGLGLVHALELESLDCFGGCTVDRVFNGLLVDVLAFCLPLLSHFLNLSLDFSLSLFYFFLSRNSLLEVDGIVDEATVSLDKSFEFFIFAVLCGIFFEVQSHNGSSLKSH